MLKATNLALPILTLALTLTSACAHKDGQTPAKTAPGAASSPVTGATVTAAAEAAPKAHDFTIFAAYGMCADKLVRRYAYQVEFRNEVKAQLKRQLIGLRLAKHYQVKSDSFLANVQQTYVHLRDSTLPFETYYRDFVVCTRRSDDKVLSHAELNADLAELKTEVEKLGPLPEPQTKTLIEE